MEYLEKNYYKNNEIDKKNIKKIAHIDATIQHIADSGGKYNQPPISQLYQNRKVGVMKISEKEKLIRIAFWAKINHQMVILNIKDKPKLYEKMVKKKVDKKIQN